MSHSLLIIFLSMLVVATCHNIIEAMEPLNTEGTLECHRRLYTYKVTQTDMNGKQCRGTLSVYACWGRCDSHEVGVILD